MTRGLATVVMAGLILSSAGCVIDSAVRNVAKTWARMLRQRLDEFV